MYKKTSLIPARFEVQLPENFWIKVYARDPTLRDFLQASGVVCSDGPVVVRPLPSERRRNAHCVREVSERVEGRECDGDQRPVLGFFAFAGLCHSESLAKLW